MIEIGKRTTGGPPDAVLEDEMVRLRNVRNWNHDANEVVSREWIDEVVINPAEIERVWFALAPPS